MLGREESWGKRSYLLKFLRREGQNCCQSVQIERMTTEAYGECMQVFETESTSFHSPTNG